MSAELSWAAKSPRVLESDFCRAQHFHYHWECEALEEKQVKHICSEVKFNLIMSLSFYSRAEIISGVVAT